MFITKTICKLFPNNEKRDNVALFVYNNIKIFIIIKNEIIFFIVSKISRLLIFTSAKTSIRLYPKCLLNLFLHYADKRMYIGNKLNKIIDKINILFNIPKYLQ